MPSSVQRNRLKRRIREAFRLHPVKRAGFDVVVALRDRFAPSAEKEVVAEIRDLFHALCTPQ
jgi:ribonuclease P protein component